MSTDQNKARLRRVFEEGWNQGNLAVFDEVLAPDFLYHDPDAPTIRTREDYKHYVTEIHRVFPDLHVTIEDVIAEGGQVMVRWTLQAPTPGISRRRCLSLRLASRSAWRESPSTALLEERSSKAGSRTIRLV